MKRQLTLLLAMTFMLSAVAPAAILAGGHDGPRALRSYYENWIDVCIQKLDSKARYLHSSSQALQHEALRAAMKKVFLEQYREQLVDQMIRDHVSRKDYKVNYYLDRQFYGVIQPRLAMR